MTSLRCGATRARPRARMLGCVREIARDLERTDDRRTSHDGRLRHRFRRLRHRREPRLLPRRARVRGHLRIWCAPLSYACLCRDVVALHLLAAARTKRLPGQGGLCIFVRDVDQLYAELSGRGARPSTSRRIAITACAISTSLMPMAINSPSAWVSRNPAEAMPAQPCWHSSSPEGMICEVFEGYLNVPPCNFMRSCSYLRRALARRHLR